jgi:DNA-directed RNA polymerase subunit F
LLKRFGGKNVIAIPKNVNLTTLQIRELETTHGAEHVRRYLEKYSKWKGEKRIANDFSQLEKWVIRAVNSEMRKEKSERFKKFRQEKIDRAWEKILQLRKANIIAEIPDNSEDFEVWDGN